MIGRIPSLTVCTDVCGGSLKGPSLSFVKRSKNFEYYAHTKSSLQVL